MTAVFGLPYKQVWAIDFEFVAEPGCVPDVVCLVARDLVSNRLIRLWKDEIKPDPPFDVGVDALFVAYMAPAEMGCFLQLGWQMPANVLDLYTEFRSETNGLILPHGRGLFGALSYHALASITKEEKQDMRDLVLTGGPWTEQQRRDILAYCQGDVDCLGPLLERMLPRITARPRGLENALLRGEYMKTVAVMEHNGVPIDTETLGRLREHWTDDQGRADPRGRPRLSRVRRRSVSGRQVRRLSRQSGNQQLASVGHREAVAGQGHVQGDGRVLLVPEVAAGASGQPERAAAREAAGRPTTAATG